MSQRVESPICFNCFSNGETSCKYLICVGFAIYYFRSIVSLKFLKSDCKFDAFKDILKVQ